MDVELVIDFHWYEKATINIQEFAYHFLTWLHLFKLP